jgi:hypothetical protein
MGTGLQAIVIAARPGRTKTGVMLAARAEAETDHASQVRERGADDFYLTVRVLGPGHGNLIDTQPAALREHQEFGIEKPRLIFDGGKQ